MNSCYVMYDGIIREYLFTVKDIYEPIYHKNRYSKKLDVRDFIIAIYYNLMQFVIL